MTVYMCVHVCETENLLNVFQSNPLAGYMYIGIMVPGNMTQRNGASIRQLVSNGFCYHYNDFKYLVL